MNKISAGMLGLMLLSGTAWSLPAWHEASKASEAIKAKQAQFAGSWEARRVSQDAGSPVPMNTITQRLRDAAERLIRADRENPQTRRSDMDMKGNPYATAPGDNGLVDQKEARSTNDPLAISMYGAAADLNGAVYSEGGGGSWEEKIMPSFTPSLGSIRLFEQFLEQVLARLDTDRDRSLTGVEMEALPAEMVTYFTETFHGSGPAGGRLTPLHWKKAEQLVRDVYSASAGIP